MIKSLLVLVSLTAVAAAADAAGESLWHFWPLLLMAGLLVGLALSFVQTHTSTFFLVLLVLYASNPAARSVWQTKIALSVRADVISLHTGPKNDLWSKTLVGCVRRRLLPCLHNKFSLSRRDCVFRLARRQSRRVVAAQVL